MTLTTGGHIYIYAQEDSINFASEPDTPDEYPDYPPPYPTRWFSWWNVLKLMKTVGHEDDGYQNGDHEDDDHDGDNFYAAGMTRRRCPISVNTTTAPPMTPYVSGPM